MAKKSNNPEFYQSQDGKSIIQLICCQGEGTLTCCGETMTLMTANTSEGAAEKHLPVVEREGSQLTVRVGNIFHPMTEEHSIGWVYLQTEKGGQRVNLEPDQEPVVRFVIASGDTPTAVYAYCNLHGFWKTDIR